MAVYTLRVAVPITHKEQVKQEIFKAGAGKYGKYDMCCFETEGTGQFRALDGANPFIGKHGEVEYVKEVMIECIVAEEYIKSVITALRNSHPYEQPAFQYWKVNIK